MLRDLSRTRRRRSARRVRSRTSSLAAGELVGDLQRGEHGDGVRRCGLGAALHFAHFFVDQVGERLHVRLFGVAFDGVALAGDGHGDGPFQGGEASLSDFRV